MLSEVAILSELKTLQALHQEGLQRATAIIAKIEGEAKASPKNRNRKAIATGITARRNVKIRAAGIQNA